MLRGIGKGEVALTFRHGLDTDVSIGSWELISPDGFLMAQIFFSFLNKHKIVFDKI